MTSKPTWLPQQPWSAPEARADAPSAMTPTGDDDEENDLVWRLLHPLWSHGPTGPAHLDRDAAVSDMRQAAAEIQRLSAPTPSAARNDEPVAWPKPISTAPTDGTVFIAHQNDDIYKCAWREEEPDEGPPRSGWYDFANKSFEDPTHWQPMEVTPAQSTAITDWEALKLSDREYGDERGPLNPLRQQGWNDCIDWMRKQATPPAAAPDQGVRALQQAGLALDEIIQRTVNPAPTNMSDRRVLDWVNGKARATHHTVNAALSRPAPDAAGSEWKDISTAPKDGTRVLAWSENKGARETYWRLYGVGSPAREAFIAGNGPSGAWNWDEPQNHWSASWEPTRWTSYQPPVVSRQERGAAT